MSLLTHVDSAQAIADSDQPLLVAELQEARRRREWSRVPREARIGIRRLHNAIRHKRKEVMLILKGAKADPELILARKNFKCDACAVSQEGEKTHPVQHLLDTSSSHAVIVDMILETQMDVIAGCRSSVAARVIIRSFMLNRESSHLQGNVLRSSPSIGAGRVPESRRNGSRFAFIPAKGLRDRGVMIPTAGLESLDTLEEANGVEALSNGAHSYRMNALRPSQTTSARLTHRS